MCFASSVTQKCQQRYSEIVGIFLPDFSCSGLSFWCVLDLDPIIISMTPVNPTVLTRCRLGGGLQSLSALLIVTIAMLQ